MLRRDLDRLSRALVAKAPPGYPKDRKVGDPSQAAPQRR